MKPSAIIIPLLLFAFSCDTSEPPSGGEPSVQFAAVDASCTEVWLQVKMLAGVPQRTIRIQRDSTVILNTTVVATETVIVDEGLLPNRLYNYTLLRSAGLVTERVTTHVTSLDTTSHNFAWQIDTLGVASSTLYDIVIISDGNIWVVGELYLNDSSGRLDPQRYNFAEWNGTSWRIERLIYQGSPPVLRSISAFGKNDVWLDPWFHWNGQTFGEIPVDPIFIGIGVNKMWGSPDGRLYAVGNGGFIAERNTSGTWQRIESGTTVNLWDIWGSPDGGVIWACGYTNDYSQSVLLQGIGLQWRIVAEVPISAPPRADSLSGSIASVWTNNTEDVEVATSGGMYRAERTSNGNAHRQWYPDPNAIGFFHRVRGSARNNIFAAGAFGTLAHFNGISWHVYEQFIDFTSGVNLLSIAANQSSVIAVGYKSGRAFVIHGRR